MDVIPAADMQGRTLELLMSVAIHSCTSDCGQNYPMQPVRYNSFHIPILQRFPGCAAASVYAAASPDQRRMYLTVRWEKGH